MEHDYSGHSELLSSLKHEVDILRDYVTEQNKFNLEISVSIAKLQTKLGFISGIASLLGAGIVTLITKIFNV
jgi:hypothetical protein